MSTVFEKHIWTEVIAFDPELPDFGVPRYISNCGFKPDRVSLLSCCPDFVHLHTGEIDDTVLLREYCSYGARPFPGHWTRRKLKGLIDTLHEHGVPVWLSCMASMLHPQFEQISEWATSHREVLMTDKDGNQSIYPEGRFELCLLNPLARFKDGSYYQDFFGEQLARTLVDYGYDGFHGADGYKCLIKTLEHADYSESIVAQFEEAIGDRIPSPTDGHAVRRITFQADYIWQHFRIAWIEFYCRRWAEFWRVVSHHVQAAGKGLCANSAWNMGPVDAIQRFGIDYRRLYESGVRELYYEGGAGGAWSILGPYAGPDSDTPGGWVIPWEEIFIDGNSALLAIKGYAPGTRVLPFTATYDPFECLDPFHQLPPYVERDIFSQAQLYLSSGADEQPANCVPGMIEVLADKLEPHEWKWIDDRWNAVARAHASRRPGPCLVWSDRILEPEIREGEKTWGTHRLLVALQLAGLPVISTARIEDLSNGQSGLLLLLNPGAFPDEEVNRILALACSGTPVAIVGEADAWVAPSDNLQLLLRDYWSDLTMWLYCSQDLRGELGSLFPRLKAAAARSAGRLGVSRAREGPGGNPLTWTLMRGPGAPPYELTPAQTFHFLTRIPPKRVPPSFMELAAVTLNRIGWPQIEKITVRVGPTRREPLGARGLAVFIETGPKEGMIMIENFTMRVIWVDITMDRTVTEVTPFGFYPAQPSVSDGNQFDLRIPMQGALLARVTW